jgi:hypothetical protein
MIKRKYKSGEFVKKGEWYICVSPIGLRSLNNAKQNFIVLDVSGDYYKVNQEVAKKAMELPPEPQHGEVWLVSNDDDFITSALFFKGSFYFSVYDNEKAIGKLKEPVILVRKIGMWLEENK